MGRFAGKAALVTGATGGIGRATAVALAREGASVVVTGRRADAGQETVRLIEAAGGRGLFVAADAADPNSAKLAVDAALTSFGRLDLAFNNAGVEESPAPITDQTEAEFDRVIAVNVKGVWACLKHEVAAMLRGGGGAIVNNASIGGLIGMPLHAVYSASKHAVNGLTKSVALEVATHGIRVNAVAPGGVQTPMLDRVTATPDGLAKMARLHPMARIATPDEIAAAVLWLLAPEATFVTGTVLAVDGGFTAR